MRNRLKKLPMQQRMTLSFAIPLILLLIILYRIFWPYLIEDYTDEMRSSEEKSFDQAVSFVESCLQNMALLAQIVENDGEIQSILFSDDFQVSQPLNEQYYDFYNMNRAMDQIEFSNSVYRLCLYVPDELSYSENQYFFYGESRLAERSDYEEMITVLSAGNDYIAISEEKTSSSSSTLTQMVTLYHAIHNQSNLFSSAFWVCSISVSAERFQTVMENTDITVDGLTCLLNATGEMVLSSNEELAAALASETSFPDSDSTAWEPVSLSGADYYVFCDTLNETGWSMLTLVPVWEFHQQSRVFRSLFLSLIVIIILIIVADSALLSRNYVNRLRFLSAKMKDLEDGDLNVRLQDVQQGDEIEEVYHNFNLMVAEVRHLMQEQYKLGKSVQEAELRALQAQINPHFLYNTLDLVNWIAMDYQADEIEAITWNLARFYRLSLNHGKSLISIRDEMEHTQVYVNLQNYHYDNQIQMTTDIDEDLLDLACLNIILQPFVENSIVHGIAEDSHITSCHIHISIHLEQGDILLCVQDDGPGMTAQQMEDAVSMDSRKLEKGYGIKNINFRIKLCFGEKYGVHYDSAPGKGTTAYILFPAMSMAEAEAVLM
ncbi:MAG: histidine kinase [Lachnospiraceae bacterium]|nr:histidine kinase [Lachnospiraceae bacterium]